MPRSRRSTLLLTVATLALSGALGACSTTATGDLEASIRSPSGGPTEPVGESSKVDAGRLTRIARATEAAGDLGNAAAMYQRAASLDPDSIDALLALAGIYYRLGVPENAAHTYRAVIARRPDNLEARRGLGNALIVLEKPEEALIEFERLIAADPLEPRGYSGRGVALSMAGRYDEARESFETGLKLAPEDIQLNNNLALSLAMSGRPTEAIPILKRLSSQSHAPERVRENLALAERSAADSVRVSDLGPPPAHPTSPSDVLYQASPVTAQPEAANSSPTPATAAKLERPITLAPETPAGIDVRQASSLVEDIKRTTQPDDADPRDIPTAAAEPAAGGIDPDRASGLVVIATPTAAAPRPAATPFAPATAQHTAELVTNSESPPRIIIPASPLARAPAVAAPIATHGAAVSPEKPHVKKKIQTDIETAKPDAAENAASDPSTATEVTAGWRPPRHRSAAVAQSSISEDRPSAGEPAAVSSRFAPKVAGINVTATLTSPPDRQPGNAGTSAYRVQLSAEPTSEEEIAHWQRLTASEPDLLRGLTSFISTTPNGSGFLYRLRTNPMPLAAAQALCNALTLRDVPCYLAATGGAASANATDTAKIAPAAGDAAVPRPSSSRNSENELRPWDAL